MVTDHLSDMVARIKNGYQAGLPEVEIPITKSVFEVAKVLAEEGYVSKVEKRDGKLMITLKYENNKPAIMGMKMVSKPGVRIYSGVSAMPKVLSGLGINILSTPKGILSSKKAKKVNAGGEIICQVW